MRYILATIFAICVLAVSLPPVQAAVPPDGQTVGQAPAFDNSRAKTFDGDLILAQGPPPDGEWGGPPFGDRSEESIQKIRTMVMYKMVEKLKIDEDTATKVLPIFLNYMKQRDELHHEHRSIIREIIDGADDESVSVDVLKKKVTQLDENENKLDSVNRKFNEEAKKYLNERQMVKLRVFDDILKQDIISEMRDRRGRNRNNDSSSQNR